MSSSSHRVEIPNYATHASGVRILECTSSVGGCGPDHLLEDSESLVWLSQVGMPQYVTLDLSSVALLHPPFSAIGWCSWYEFTTNPRRVEIYASDSGSRFHRIASVVCDLRPGFHWIKLSLSSSDRYLRFVVRETYGSAQTCLHQLILTNAPLHILGLMDVCESAFKEQDILSSKEISPISFPLTSFQSAQPALSPVSSSFSSPSSMEGVASRSTSSSISSSQFFGTEMSRRSEKSLLVNDSLRKVQSTGEVIVVPEWKVNSPRYAPSLHGSNSHAISSTILPEPASSETASNILHRSPVPSSVGMVDIVFQHDDKIDSHADLRTVRRQMSPHSALSHSHARRNIDVMDGSYSNEHFFPPSYFRPENNLSSVEHGQSETQSTPIALYGPIQTGSGRSSSASSSPASIPEDPPKPRKLPEHRSPRFYVAPSIPGSDRLHGNTRLFQPHEDSIQPVSHYIIAPMHDTVISQSPPARNWNIQHSESVNNSHVQSSRSNLVWDSKAPVVDSANHNVGTQTVQYIDAAVETSFDNQLSDFSRYTVSSNRDVSSGSSCSFSGPSENVPEESLFYSEELTQDLVEQFHRSLVSLRSQCHDRQTPRLESVDSDSPNSSLLSESESRLRSGAFIPSVGFDELSAVAPLDDLLFQLHQRLEQLPSSLSSSEDPKSSRTDVIREVSSVSRVEMGPCCPPLVECTSPRSVSRSSKFDRDTQTVFSLVAEIPTTTELNRTADAIRIDSRNCIGRDHSFSRNSSSTLVSDRERESLLLLQELYGKLQRKSKLLRRLQGRHSRSVRRELSPTRRSDPLNGKVHETFKDPNIASESSKSTSPTGDPSSLSPVRCRSQPPLRVPLSDMAAYMPLPTPEGYVDIQRASTIHSSSCPSQMETCATPNISNRRQYKVADVAEFSPTRETQTHSHSSPGARLVVDLARAWLLEAAGLRGDRISGGYGEECESRGSRQDIRRYFRSRRSKLHRNDRYVSGKNEEVDCPLDGSYEHEVISVRDWLDDQLRYRMQSQTAYQ